MRFELTILAILVCLAPILQNGDAKPLSKVKSERELTVLDDLITYLSRRGEDGELPMLPPLKPPSDDRRPPEIEDLSLGGDTDDQEEQGEGGNGPENTVQNDDSKAGEQNNIEDNENGPVDGGVEKEEKENGVASVIEENLNEEFDEIQKNVDDLLTLIKKGLKDGDLNKIYDVLLFLKHFLIELGNYNKNLQPQVKSTEEALKQILFDMRKAAEQLEKSDSKTNDDSLDEESESSAGNEEEKKPIEDIFAEDKPANGGGEEDIPTGGDGDEEKPEGGPGDEEKPEGGPGDEEKPEGGAGDEEKPEGGPGDEEKPEGGPGEEEKPEGGAGGEEKPEEDAGEEEKPEGGAGNEEKPEEGAGGEEKPEEGAGEEEEPAGGDAAGGGENGGRRLQSRRNLVRIEELLRLLEKIKQ